MEERTVRSDLEFAKEQITRLISLLENSLMLRETPMRL